MSMYEEIEKFMNSVDSSINYRLVNMGGKFLYIEGLKSVVSLGTESMSFQLRQVILDISGKNLKLSYLDKASCVIEGEITSVVVG